MKLTRKSSITGEFHTMELPITKDQLDEYFRTRKLVQEVFPDLTDDQREFIMTGITQEEWDKHIKSSEDE